MSKDKHKDIEPKDVGTTGHSWDGIEELNNPLPRWWLWTFLISIIWGIGWTIAYPAWPLISSATPGLLGYSSRQEVEDKVVEDANMNAALEAELAEADLASIDPGSELANYATKAGKVVFQTSCATCHGVGANGAKGYPNLIDDDWLWGGDFAAIHYTIEHGIRSSLSEDTRYSEMPAWKEILSAHDIDAVANYVISLSGTPENQELVEHGGVIFAENCASCHGENATGIRDVGAPNLADAIWLHGDDLPTIRATITEGRNREMPAWGKILSPAEIQAVTYYVHQLGGGE